MLDILWENLFTPGFAAGVIIGAVAIGLASYRGWFKFGHSAAVEIENARLIAELKAALDRIEDLEDRLTPFVEFQEAIMASALAQKIKGSGDD